MNGAMLTRSNACNPRGSVVTIAACCAALVFGMMSWADDSVSAAKDDAVQKQPSEPRRGDAMRWRPDGPMPQEMIDRVIAVARDVSPELATQLSEQCNKAPDEMSQAMRQSARRLVALAVLKERNPDLYAIRVEDVRLQLELRTLGDAYRAAQTAGDATKTAALGAQIAAKVRAQVDIDLKARAQELLALDEQMEAMRDDLVKEQRNTDARVAERTDAVKNGQPIQERGMFGEGGAGGERRGKPRPEQPAAAKP
jgi:hypothetical protein